MLVCLPNHAVMMGWVAFSRAQGRLVGYLQRHHIFCPTSRLEKADLSVKKLK
jgi:hypothetical protein